MKKRGSKRSAQRLARDVYPNFVRGFVATGLLSVCQDRFQPNAAPIDGRRVLRHALQGGVALAAGSVAAEALQRREYGVALTFAAGAAAGLVCCDYLLRPPAGINDVEKNDEQEEA